MRVSQFKWRMMKRLLPKIYSISHIFKMNSHKRNNSTPKLIFLILFNFKHTPHLITKTYWLHTITPKLTNLIIIPLKSQIYNNLWTINSYNNQNNYLSCIKRIGTKIHPNQETKSTSNNIKPKKPKLKLNSFPIPSKANVYL